MSKATDIQACIQSNAMGADEALMLDDRGYVKTCNSTNFMIVREGLDDDAGKLVIWSPTKNNQMQGITRRRTIAVCRAAGIKVIEQDFSLTEAYGAIEVRLLRLCVTQLTFRHSAVVPSPPRYL